MGCDGPQWAGFMGRCLMAGLAMGQHGWDVLAVPITATRGFPWHWHPFNHTYLFPHQKSWRSPFQTTTGNGHCCHTCVGRGCHWEWVGPWLSHHPCSVWGVPLALPVFAEHGFVGYSEELLFNNTLPDYSQGESFFTVFGVFFPAATGTVSFILPSTGTSPGEILQAACQAYGLTWWHFFLPFQGLSNLGQCFGATGFQAFLVAMIHDSRC